MRLRLKERARRLAARRGHALGQFRPREPGSPLRVATCACGAAVVVDMDGRTINGTAVGSDGCTATGDAAERARLHVVRTELDAIEGRLREEAAGPGLAASAAEAAAGYVRAAGRILAYHAEVAP